MFWLLIPCALVKFSNLFGSILKKTLLCHSPELSFPFRQLLRVVGRDSGDHPPVFFPFQQSTFLAFLSDSLSFSQATSRRRFSPSLVLPPSSHSDFFGIILDVPSSPKNNPFLNWIVSDTGALVFPKPYRLPGYSAPLLRVLALLPFSFLLQSKAAFTLSFLPLHAHNSSSCFDFEPFPPPNFH